MYPQVSMEMTRDSRDLSRQYVASSPRRDFFSMNVAAPASGTPHTKVVGVTLFVKRPSTSGPCHAKAQ